MTSGMRKAGMMKRAKKCILQMAIQTAKLGQQRMRRWKKLDVKREQDS